MRFAAEPSRELLGGFAMHAIPRSFVCVVTYLLVLSGAQGAQISIAAFDNATVQPAGPRPGDNGKRFFNMEGNSNGGFASFGVADFAPHTPGQEGLPVRLTFEVVQANAAFTMNGDLHFWLTTDTTTDIQPSDDPAVRFIAADNPDGLDQQLVLRFFLGSGTFVQVDDEGQVDDYSFDLSPDASQYLRDQISRQRSHCRIACRLHRRCHLRRSHQRVLAGTGAHNRLRRLNFLALENRDCNV